MGAEVVISEERCGSLKLQLAKLWSFCNVAFIVTFFTVFMFVFHPLVLFAIVLVDVWNHHRLIPTEDVASLKRWIHYLVTDPMDFLLFQRSSLFGFPIRQYFFDDRCKNLGNLSAKPYVWVATLRTTTMILMLFCIDWPTAVLRPMGRSIWQKEISTCTEEYVSGQYVIPILEMQVCSGLCLYKLFLGV